MGFYWCRVLRPYSGRSFLIRVSITINRFWIEDTFGHSFIGVVRQEAAVITTGITHVTRRITVLYHADQQTILFTVHEDSAHFLHVARLFALVPDGIARTAKEVRLTGLARPLKRFRVHESHHQHFSSFIILDDSRNQSLAIKFQH